MRTTDNNGGKTLTDLGILNVSDLSCIANQSLADLQKDNPDLLIFPHSLGQYRDDVEKSHIFTLSEETLTTFNLMGFVGRNSGQLTIASRFAKNDHRDYFLHYMLQKVFSINLLKFDQKSSKEDIWDFLLYLFPYYLKKAYSKGIYKAYKTELYNDPNVKGVIDVNRHINKNIPFTGKIAYTTREHSYDNSVTQLIRHTIEHIKNHPFGRGLLTNDSQIREIIARFYYITRNSYNKNSLQKIMGQNSKPVSHPFFTEYNMLQKICLQILRRDKLTYGKENDKVYGLLFDGAWLWEEYLNTFLKNDFIHPENKTGKNRQHLFENSQPIYPDFISRSNPKKVADAKYSPLDRQNSYSENSERATAIYYKTITYMYRFTADEGFLLFPHSEETFSQTYKIKDTRGIIKKIGLAVPQESQSFMEFATVMAENEKALLKNLQHTERSSEQF